MGNKEKWEWIQENDPDLAKLIVDARKSGLRFEAVYINDEKIEPGAHERKVNRFNDKRKRAQVREPVRNPASIKTVDRSIEQMRKLLGVKNCDSNRRKS